MAVRQYEAPGVTEAYAGNPDDEAGTFPESAMRFLQWAVGVRKRGLGVTAPSSAVHEADTKGADRIAASDPNPNPSRISFDAELDELLQQSPSPAAVHLGTTLVDRTVPRPPVLV